jgi:uncharacterized phage protein (TIGR01671 family)
MREIKFRAWGFDSISQEEPKMYDWWHIKYAFDTWLDDEKCITMQYTGLLDKNGKEIYEGDIVVYLEPQGGKREVSAVYFTEGCFSVKAKNTDKDYCPCLGIVSNVEVIGSIYENPGNIHGSKVTESVT